MSSQMVMGQNPVPPVKIPIPTKIGSKMGGAPTPKWDPIDVDPQPNENGEDMPSLLSEDEGTHANLSYQALQACVCVGSKDMPQ